MNDEPLPPIRIKVDCQSRDFIKRMSALAPSVGQYSPTLETNFMGQTNFDLLNLGFTGKTPHRDFVVQFIVFPDDPNYVSFEVRASRWEPNDPPTYNDYVKEAKRHGKRLLVEYNKKYASRRRLNIASREALEPKLSPMCEALFKRFVNLANKSALHPLDWNRFYEFVAYCKSRRRYTSADIERLLVKEGFEQNYAEYIGSVYRHLCEFKRYC